MPEPMGLAAAWAAVIAPASGDASVNAARRTGAAVVYEVLQELAQRPRRSSALASLTPEERADTAAERLCRWLEQPPRVKPDLARSEPRIRGYLRRCLENRAKDILMSHPRERHVSIDAEGAPELAAVDDDATREAEQRVVAFAQLRQSFEGLLERLVSEARPQRRELVRNNYARRMRVIDSIATDDDLVAEIMAEGVTAKVARDRLHQWNGRCRETLMERLRRIDTAGELPDEQLELLLRFVDEVFRV